MRKNLKKLVVLAATVGVLGGSVLAVTSGGGGSGTGEKPQPKPTSQPVSVR